MLLAGGELDKYCLSPWVSELMYFETESGMSEVKDALEQAVAKFIVDFSAAHIDARSLEAAKTLLKDQLANQLGAAHLPWSRQVRESRQWRQGSSSELGVGLKLTAADAAYLNASYGHGFEYDDFAGNAHPGCCVVPVALAIAEELGATCEQMLVAMVAGYETYVRLGRLCTPDLLHAGWQPHSVLANFGAAAVAAKLYGLDVEKTRHALAIALSHASGTTEYASTGGSIKRVHAGIAVRNGIESVELALAGLTGPLQFLTGNRGLYKTFAGKSVGPQAAEGFLFDEPLMILNFSLKPYCCCAATHPFIDVIANLGSQVERIHSIDAYLQTSADAIVGSQNSHIYNPQNIEQLQYSLPVQMALSALSLGNGYATHLRFLRGELSLEPDSQVINLAGRIRLNVSKDLDERYPDRFVADLLLHLSDGSTLALFQDAATGTARNPLTARALRRKFDELTVPTLGQQRADDLYQFLDKLSPSTPTKQLISLLKAA